MLFSAGYGVQIIAKSEASPRFEEMDFAASQGIMNLRSLLRLVFWLAALDLVGYELGAGSMVEEI